MPRAERVRPETGPSALLARVRILLWHGYLLSGTGSNEYTRALAREWARAGHDVTVVCQERHPERFDLAGAKVVRPDIGTLLPVFVVDRYEGLEAKLLQETTWDERRMKDAVRDKNIVVGVLAVPASSAQKVADDLVDAGVRIIFNYSEALLNVPGDVTVHTSNPAVELLHALYFHLA